MAQKWQGSKREAELYTMVECAATDEKQEDRDQCRLRDPLVEFRQRKDEEDEARCNAPLMLPRMKVMKQNREYVEAFDKERGRPKTIMTILWQLMQSRDTKNMNLDEDLEEILSKMEQTGCSEAAETRRFWAQDEDEEQ